MKRALPFIMLSGVKLHKPASTKGVYIKGKKKVVNK